MNSWQLELEPEWILALVVFGLDYALVTWTLQRRGEVVPRWRRASFSAGLALIAVALLSPIEHLALTSMLSFHLLQNVLIADWAPPLILLGLTPVMVAAIARRPGVTTCVRPTVAFLIWAATWYVIHIPVVYDYALNHRAVLGLEHIAFILSGLIFWWPDLIGTSLSPRGRVIYLFAAMVVMMPLDFFIALHDTPLYSFYLHTPKIGNISALADQRIAGATAAVMETVVLSVAMFVAAARVVQDERRVPPALRPAGSTVETGTPARGRNAS